LSGQHSISVVDCMQLSWLADLHGGNGINDVALRRARLVPMGNRLTAGKPPMCRTSYPCLLSLAIHPWVYTMSTSESWGVNKHTTRYTSPYPRSRSVCWCLAER